MRDRFTSDETTSIQWVDRRQSGHALLISFTCRNEKTLEQSKFQSPLIQAIPVFLHRNPYPTTRPTQSWQADRHPALEPPISGPVSWRAYPPGQLGPRRHLSAAQARPR
jgi:hypothetical protein